MEKSLVSVIMPVYNVENYLSKAIDSVMNQSYTQLQIIIIDDGSTDSSGQLCDHYRSLDNRIEVYHKKNGGLSDARNYGLNYVRGNYIYFFDSDDYLEKTLIEKCVSIMEEKKCDLVVFNYAKIINGQIVGTTKFKPGEISLNSQNRFSFMQTDFLNCQIGWEAWGRFFSAKIITENKLRFWNNKEIFAEDLGFMLCAVLKLKKIVVIKDVLYNYVYRDDSIMGNTKMIPISKIIVLTKKFSSMENINSYYTEEQIQNICLNIIVNELGKDIKNFDDIFKTLTDQEKLYLLNLTKEYDRNGIYLPGKREKILIKLVETTLKEHNLLKNVYFIQFYLLQFFKKVLFKMNQKIKI